MKKCSKCKVIKDKTEFHKQKCKPDGLRVNCKTCRKEKFKQFYRDNKEKILSKNKEYYSKNKVKIQAKNKIYWNNKYHTDINFKLAQVLRKRLYSAIKGYSAVDDLGCSIEELRFHLESQFKDNMSWDNYGEWHIDHIKPLASFDLTNEEELKKACNYTNLQPLWAKDNLKKGAKHG